MDDTFEADLPVVHSMGLSIFDPIWARKTHSGHYAELMHVVSGSCELVTKKGRFRAAPGDTLLVPTNTAHRDEFDFGLGLHVYMVHFSWKAEAAFLRHVDNRLLQNLPAAAKAEIGKVFSYLQTDIRRDSEADKLVIRSRVLLILLLMLREAFRAKEGSKDPEADDYGPRHRRQLMLRAKAYLEGHYNAPVSLQEIAQSLRVSPFYLSHVFSEETDFSLFAYLTLLRMKKAKLLLGEGNLNVSEVASAVGYENSNYFSKVFKRHFGRSPRRFLGPHSSREK